MKKLILFAAIVAIAFTACRKTELPVNPASATSSVSSEESSKELIKKTDPDLYNRLYNSTTKTSPRPSQVIVIPGIYLFTTDVTKGYCRHVNGGVCMVVVKALTTGTSSTSTLAANLTESYAPNIAEATLYTTPSQQFYITSLNVTFTSSGDANVKMVRQ